MSEDRYREERELVERCLAMGPSGDASGVSLPWDAFIRRYTPLVEDALGRAARSYGVHLQLSQIQDLRQETFLSLFERDAAALRAFRWGCSLETYLKAVAANRCFAFLRRLPRDLDALPESEKRRLCGDLGAPPAAVSSLLDSLPAAIERLSPAEKLALRMTYWHSMPAEAVARFLGMNPNSVWPLLSRARARLKELLRGASSLLL